MPQQANPKSSSDPQARPASSRRGFLRTAGGVAAGLAFFLAGCDGENAITTNHNPTVRLAVDTDRPTAGELVTFTYSMSDPDLQGEVGESGFSSVVIDFGDGATANLTPSQEEQTITHTYAQAGQYTATITVHDNFSGSATATQQIGVDMPPFSGVELDFGNSLDVLNYAYALEQLEAAFYERAVMAIGDGALAVDGTTEAYFRDLAAHERVHRDFLAVAIPMMGSEDDLIPDLEMDFSSVDFSDLSTVLANAQMLEDVGVSAYNGAGVYLAAADTLLTLAGKIVSVEARHAAAVRALIGPELNAIDLTELTGLNANTDFSLGVAQSPQAVIDAVRSLGFITTTINDPTGLIDNPNTPT